MRYNDTLQLINFIYTLIIRTASDMYWVMFGCVGFTVFFTYVMQRREGDDYQKPVSLMEELWSKRDVELPGGQLIHFSSRTDSYVRQLFLHMI